MSNPYCPVLAPGRFKITGMSGAPKPMIDDFKPLLRRMADEVALGLADEGIDTSGVELSKVKQVRVGVLIPAPNQRGPASIYAYYAESSNPRSWVPLCSRMAKAFKGNIEALFRDRVARVCASRHAPMGATLEYKAPYREFSNHEKVALRAARGCAYTATSPTDGATKDGMKHADFKIGLEFRCGGRTWRCTDVGSRTVIAIALDDADRPSGRDESWLAGPPYAIVETVFDEYDLPACEPA